MVALKIRGISKSFGQRSVVKDVSFELRAGEIVGVLGPNGAGKTTSFYMVMGIVMPDSGSILLGEHDITTLPMYKRARLGIGYLPQDTSIFRGLSVEENIMAVLEIHAKDVERSSKLESLLSEFSITHLRKSKAMSLSGGERRRVEIARALAAEPKFLLLDEPFAGVDPIAISDIKSMILNLKRRNIGLIITDHNVRDALPIMDRAYIVYEGLILASGLPDDILSNKDVQEVYLGNSFI